MESVLSDLLTTSGAILSDCGTYRYDLWRVWDESKPTLTFIMLNPSTADDEENDPTVERCQRRAMKWGYGQLRIVNLMAYRATDPDDLRHLAEGIRWGPKNRVYLRNALQDAGTVICGWGKDGYLGPVEWLQVTAKELNVPLFCLKRNKDGSPQHPLYISYDKKPVYWGGGEEK